VGMYTRVCLIEGHTNWRRICHNKNHPNGIINGW
jgi:hypothetical protein